MKRAKIKNFETNEWIANYFEDTPLTEKEEKSITSHEIIFHTDKFRMLKFDSINDVFDYLQENKLYMCN